MPPGAVPHAEERSSSATGSPRDTDAIDADVIRALRALRFRMGEARQGAELCAHMVDASAEERVLFALRGLGRAHAHRKPHEALEAS